MSHDIALIVAFAAPALVFTVLRINAAMVFLSLCLGAVLVKYVGGEANSLITLFAPQAGSVSESSLQLVLLLAPAVATSVLMLFSVHGRIRVAFNALPAMAASMLGLLVAVPLLTPGLRYALQAEPLWRQFTRAQALVVGVGALVSLAFLWTQRRNFRQGDKRRR